MWTRAEPAAGAAAIGPGPGDPGCSRVTGAPGSVDRVSSSTSARAGRDDRAGASAEPDGSPLPGAPAAEPGRATGSATGSATTRSAGSAAGRIRSLADDLRARSDEELAQLLLRRPDLARPAPGDLTSLAARSVTRASLTRALDDLDTGHLQVLEAIAVLGDAGGVGPVARLLQADSARVGPVLDELWRRGLLWRSGRTRHVPRPVAEAVGPHIAGLAPATRPTTFGVDSPTAPGASGGPGGPGDPDGPGGPGGPGDEPGIAPDDLGPHERAILDRLTWGPPVGHLPAEGAAAEAGRVLLRAGWLVAGADGQVVLPRERALRLRGGRLHRESALDPAPLGGDQVPDERLAAVAGGQAVHLLELVEELVARWSADPPRVLRSGGLAVRDLRAVAESLEVPLGLAAFVVELAHDAGLVADDGQLDPAWTPTHYYDDWSERPTAARWSELVRAWLRSTRAPHRVGSRPAGASGPGAVNALSEGASWPRLRLLRREILAELLGVPPGRLVAEPDLVARLRWRHPLRPPAAVQEAVDATCRGAEWLGVTGRGAIPEPVRALLAAEGVAPVGAEPEADDRSGPPPEVLDGIAAMLPEPVEQMIVQADLTAVVPGPLGPRLGALLRLAAEPESRGGASVFRFTPTSVRRCLDAGWDAQRLLDALTGASATPLPQPLTYLVGDVARRHGALRIGAVSSYVRCDDPAALDALLSERALASAGLRRLAPTVVVSALEPLGLLDALRAAGASPVLEGADGIVLGDRPEQRRTRRRELPAVTLLGPTPSDARALVTQMRAGQEARDREAATHAHSTGPSVPAADPTVVLALVREAIARRGAVWIGLADSAGGTRRVLLHPVRVEGGRIHGHLESESGAPARRAERSRSANGTASAELPSVSLHRITGALLAE